MINLTLLWAKAKPYVFLLIGLAIGYFLFQGCPGNSTNDDAVKALNTSLAESKKKELALLKQNDTLKNEKQLFKDSIAAYVENEKSYVAEIASLKKRGTEKKAEIKVYNTNDYAEFFASRYPEVADGISITSTGLTITDSVANPIATDLISFDVSLLENKIKDKIIIEKEKTISAQDSINEKSEQEKKNLQAIVDQKNIDDDKQNKTIKDQQKSINQKENANLFWKIAAGVTFGIGVLIGTR